VALAADGTIITVLAFNTSSPFTLTSAALNPFIATLDASGNLFATLQIRVTDSNGVTRLSAPINVQLVAPSGGGKPPGDG
jgi:hypothetical protein